MRKGLMKRKVSCLNPSNKGTFNNYIKMKPRYNRLLGILFISFLGMSGYAQQGSTINCDSLNNIIFGAKLPGTAYMPDKIGVNSQFFNDSWLPGVVHLTHKEDVQHVKLKYNGYLDALILLLEGNNQMVKLDKELIAGFEMEDPAMQQTYKFCRIRVNKEIDSTAFFARQLYANKISLWVYPKIIAGIPIEVRETKVVSYKNVYEPSPLYYFILSDGRLIHIKSWKKKHLVSLFPGKEEIIKKALRDNKQHRFKTETDLIKITGILNALGI